VTSTGAVIRPVLRIVHPSAVRVRDTRSTPTCVPRRKIAKLDVAASVAGAGGAVWAEAIDTQPANAMSAAQLQWRTDMTSAYQAARNRAAFIDRSARGRIVVSGRDRASYLQGLLTNDIPALKAGEGCYAAYLTPQGRMISDLWVYELGDVILLNLAGDVTAAVLAKLDQFIFSEDVKLGDVSETFAQIAVVGPDAARIVGALLDEPPAAPDVSLGALPEHGNLRGQIDGSPVIVTRVTDTGEPGFDVYVERERSERLKTRLVSEGAQEAGEETADVLRVEAGVPAFHHDMDEDTIPLEAGIESRAISMTKGCYVGQEVIIRVLHRGHGRVAKKLVGLVLDGESPPARGTIVKSADRAAGAITSSVRSPALGRAIALAYLQRDFIAPGTSVSIEGVPATVTPLPFFP
jgi:folate-binding protein YgfZ